MGTKPPGKKWKKRSKIVTATDPILKNPLPTDIIIPIMGPTGSGKSILVNVLAGREAVAVGNDLDSCTVNLCPVIIEPEDWMIPMVDRMPRRLVLVDTPGFDDTYVDDSEILRRISVWLAASYNDSMKIAGVIFLNEISRVSIRGTGRRNIDVFKKLCGADMMKYVALCTTMWEGVPLDLAEKRKYQLRETYWKDMITGGAQVVRIYRGCSSAWGAVNTILSEFNNSRIMCIQKELVDLQKLLPDTKAARSLQGSLNRELEQQRQWMKHLVESVGENERQKQREEIQRTLDQIVTLNMSLCCRIRNFFTV
ncbi:hypothetical protein D9619_009217 [Psilocybe cf. subviscida]|uniref:G domain-containing protein n=1 Tax=Psilocybe cf. subviscida TaxID=2480587 RepID=A0A8H5FA35_9AGAR|nr:hypothetical protein D9619_009217 [Psilocybe cf. subviscida]